MNKTNVLNNSIGKICLGGIFLTISQVFFIREMPFDITPNFIGTLLILWAINTYNSSDEMFKKIYLKFKLLTGWFVVAFIILLFAFIGKQIVWFHALYMWIDFIAIHYSLYLIIKILTTIEKNAGYLRKNIKWYILWITLTLANMCSIIASQATVVIGPISQAFVLGVGTMIFLSAILEFASSVMLIFLFFITSKNGNYSRI
nr:hypothetical protein [uncultured Niameybacter sp.]